MDSLHCDEGNGNRHVPNEEQIAQGIEDILVNDFQSLKGWRLHILTAG